MNASPRAETAVTSGGDRQRFDSLFQRHVGDIASYCRWRSHSPADAEDAVAEVFLIAWRRLGDVPVGDDARLWLYATARRVLSNQARANARRHRLSEKLSTEPFTISADEDPRVERVREALAALRPSDRELLLLVEWQGLTPAEVASMVHRPPVAVRVRLHRARRRFRAAYEVEAADADRTRLSISPQFGKFEP